MIMKKVLAFIACIAALAVLSGCGVLSTVTGKTPEELHNEAVAKVGEYAEKLAMDKIDKADYLTEEAKIEFKAEVTKIKDEIIIKINELRDKAVAKKAEKEAAKKAEKEAAEND